MILDSLAYLDTAEGDLDRAGVRRAQALDIALGSRDEGLVSQVLIGVAEQAILQRQFHEAARLLVASEQAGRPP
jgi:hypothetical protein